MANGIFGFLGSLFGQPKKRQVGLGAGSAISPDIPGFKDLRGRVEGAQIGFGSEFVNRSTSPFIAEREAGFNLRERPALEESFASRGLGRSSLAGREVGQAFAQKERDINQILAQAFQENLRQGKTDEAAQISNLFNIGTAEASQQALSARDVQGRRQFQIGQEQQRDLGETQAARFGTGLLAKPLLPAIGGAVSRVGSAIGGGLGDFISDIGGGINTSFNDASPFRKNDVIAQIVAALAAQT